MTPTPPDAGNRRRSPFRSRRRGNNAEILTTAGIAALWLLLALLLRPAAVVPAERFLLVGALVFLACALPIVPDRARRITFTPAVVFGGALLVGPWAAGVVALAAGALHTALLRRTAFWESLAASGLYVVATLPVALI